MRSDLLAITLIMPLTLTLSAASQQWEQLTGEPEGGGITDIFLDDPSGVLYVATGSLNWPNGEDGGIRRSEDDGATWTNIFDAYTSRFVTRAADGHLYASVWNYPGDEGLYRSENDGNIWNQLLTVPSGNNIFAFALKESTPNILFAGTGMGIMRSFDNGMNWAYANTGLPANTLVRSLAVSPDGNTIAAGTVNGLYVSSDDGDSWQKVTGDGEDEIISSVAFDMEPAKSGVPLIMLLYGSESGKLFVANSQTLFTVGVLVTTYAIVAGVTRIMAHRHPTTMVPTYMASLYAATGGGFAYAVAGLAAWQMMMNGLPSNPMISMFTSHLIISTAAIVVYLAMYGDAKETAAGSEIYKATFDVSTDTESRPFARDGFNLFQNIPNPFGDQTRINFELPEAGFTSLKVFDLAGNEVLTLVEGMKAKGRHSIDLSNDGLVGGMYYYVLSTGNLSQTRKLVVR